jgi:hypothetical protein
MTMPTSQPVDYVALCHALVEDESLHPDDTQEFRSLAELLGTLREVVNGCGTPYPRPSVPTLLTMPCSPDNLCYACLGKLFPAITALTYTDQGGTHEDR